MCAAQPIGNQGRLGVRRRRDPHCQPGSGGPASIGTGELRHRVAAGQPARDRADGVGQRSCATVRFGKRQHRAIPA